MKAQYPEPYIQGEFAERCAAAHGISRQQQDDHAEESFRRAQRAAEAGLTARVRCKVPCPKSKSNVFFHEEIRR